MIIKRITQVLYSLVSLAWLCFFMLLVAHPVLIGVALIIALPALPLMFGFAMAAPDATAGGFFIMYCIPIAVIIVSIAKIGLIFFRFFLYYKRVNKLMAVVTPVSIGVTNILLTFLLFFLLSQMFTSDVQMSELYADRYAIGIFLTLEGVLLVLDTFLLYGRFISSIVSKLLAVPWSFFGYFIPGVYVLGAKGAGWRRAVALLQFLLFLFVVQGFYLGHYGLASILMILIMFWGYNSRRSFIRKQERLENEPIATVS